MTNESENVPLLLDESSSPAPPNPASTSTATEQPLSVESEIPLLDTSVSSESTILEDLENCNVQTLLVNKLIKTIGRLRNENALLELRISESDKHNKVLQLQIDIMMKKMDLLEGFMSQVQQMDKDGCNPDRSTGLSHVCKKCKKHITNHKNGMRNVLENLSDSDDDADTEELMEMWNTDAYDGENSVQNPLQIDVVVYNVMKFLPMKHLLICRHVNHLWCMEATYVIKQRKILTIGRDNIDKLSSLLSLMSTTTGEEDSSLVSFPRGFLCHKVKFNIGFLVKTYREVLEEFFKKYGAEIYNFSIHCEQDHTSLLYTEEFRNVFLPHLKNVQTLEISVPTKLTERQTIYDDIRPKKLTYDNLTTLKLRQMDVSLDIGGYSVTIVKELLQLGPNLRSLGIETHTREVVTRIIQVLSEKEIRNIANQLTELYLDSFITEEHLMLLLPIDFKLKVLQLSYFVNTCSSAMIEAFLCKQRTTLRTLILGDYQKRTTTNSLPLIIKLPVMRELHNLKFVDPLFPDHRQLILNPLNYSEQLPCISEINFDHDVGKPVGPHYFQDMFVCSPSTCQNLTTLRISHGLADPQMVSSAANMFPNLKTLELANASDPVIQMVWKEFAWIISLKLILNPTNLNIDSLMTGIPDQVCRRIQEKNLFSQVDVMNALDIIRTESSICNLTELESLRIDGFTSSLMTAVTGYLAFSHMPNLTSVSIKADIVTLSRECRRVLGEKLHLSLFELF